MSFSIDCGFVIALQEEADGTLLYGGLAEHLETTIPSTNAEFIEFTFHDHAGTARSGIATIIQGMTPHVAYQRTLKLLDKYTPAVVLNIGIAGSLADWVQVGDVVVAPYADNYDSRAKAIPTASEGFTFAFAGVPHRADWSRFDLIRRLKGTRRYTAWQERCSRRVQRLDPSLLALLRSREILGADVKLHDGPIASGYSVGASPAFKTTVLGRNRDFLALEMEAAGVVEACNERNIPAIVLKAISDPADDTKRDLEALTKDELRAFAMSNALDLSGVVVRSVLTFSQTDAGDIRDRLLTLAERHFKKQHHHLAANIDDNLHRYDNLFRPVIVDLPSQGPGDTLFDRLAQSIAGSTAHFPLRVDGKPGTGKTTFLTLLFLALYKQSKQNPQAPIPVYVNLKRYLTPKRGAETVWNSEAAARDDLSMLAEILEGASANSLAILIDGIDEYVRYDDAVEQSVFQLISRHSPLKKIVAIGSNYLYDKERFRRELPQFNNPQHLLVLGSVPLTDSARAATLVGSFVGLREPQAPNQSDIIHRVLARAEAFGLRRIDLLLVEMLVNSLESRSYSTSGRPTDFFIRYCEDFLQDSDQPETITSAAQLAFDYTVKDAPLDLSQCIRRRAWKLLHSHPVIADFLIACHAINAIRAAGRGERERLPDLDYVYPHRVNRFCKDLANASRDVQFEVLDGAKRVYAEGENKAKPHGCYLAGRLENHDAKALAESWLRTCKIQVDQGLATGTRSRTDLLVARTVYISLAYIGDQEASEDYIRFLLEDEEGNDINRGFHLEYYDDIPFEPGRFLSHHDTLDSCVNTFWSLRDRVMSGLNKPRYGLLNIEVFTLFSLAQHRHLTRGSFDEAMRRELIELIPTILRSDRIQPIVRDYLTMLAENLSQNHFPIGRLAEKLYGLKTEPRVGWLRRDLNLERVESVAEHMYGAYLLGLIYLPNGNPENWRGYSKTDVLQMVLIHDLGEAIIGDYTPDEATDAKRNGERDAMTYIRMCGTYPYVSNLDDMFNQWSAFEHGSNENARIARDLDKLDNLVQLYIYSKQRTVPGRQQWIEQLSRGVTTLAGRRILQIVKDNFEENGD